MTASTTMNAAADEKTEPLHISAAALVSGILGFALWGIGSLIRAVNLENVEIARALEVVGPLLIALAIILYVDHLSNRIGRTAVALLIIGPIVYGISRIPALLEWRTDRWARYEWTSYAVGHLLVGLGLMMVAVHKERQLHAALDHYESNAGGPAPEITVHASFISLLSAAGGLILVAISLLVLVAVTLALQYTRLGRATRAVADNPALAASTGINVNRVISTVWIVGTALAGLGGAFLGFSQSVTYQLGAQVLLLIFAATCVGGLGSIWGAMLGSVIIGLFVELSTLVIPSQLKYAGAMVLLIVVLLVRPQGLLGRSQRVG